MGSSFLSPTFVIGYIRIGSVEGASCVNLGNNSPSGFQSHKKHNQGFGNVGGDHNQIRGLRSTLEDNDMLDMQNGLEEEIPAWVRQSIRDAAAE